MFISLNVVSLLPGGEYRHEVTAQLRAYKRTDGLWQRDSFIQTTLVLVFLSHVKLNCLNVKQYGS